MKPYERRRRGNTTYYKLAFFDERAACWHDLSKQHETVSAAHFQAGKLGEGKYRLSVVVDGKRNDLKPFLVTNVIHDSFVIEVCE